MSSDAVAERTFTLRADPTSVRLARRSVTEFATEHRLSSELIEAAQLCVSELVTNAVTAASDGRVILTVCLDATHLTILVTNVSASADLPDADSLRLPAASASSGRGLAIVRQLADQLRIERDGTSVTVSAGFAAN